MLMKRDKLNAIVLLLITMILSISLAPPFTGGGHDKQVFIYGAMAIWKGQIPYKAFYDHKPPLIFLFLALAWPFKAWGYYVLGVLTKWIVCLFIYRVAKSYQLSNAWLYPVVFLICLLPPFILSSGLLTREYAACLLAILFSVILTNPGKKYILTGALCAFVFHMQQEELLLAFPFVIYHLSQPVNGSKVSAALFFNRILLMAAGFLLVTAPLLIWVAVKGALTDYWQQSFLFNLVVYESRRPVLYKIRGILSILFHTRFMFLMFPLLAFHLFYIVKEKKASLQLACFFTLLIALFVKTFAGRISDHVAVYHYLLTYSAIVAMSVIAIAKEKEQYIPKHYLKPLAFVFLTGLFFVIWKNSFVSLRQMKYSKTYDQMEELTNRLQDVRDKDGQLYVMAYTPFLVLNNNLNCLSPTKWIYTSQYSQHLEDFDRDGNVIKEIIAGLEKNKTTYVVDFCLITPVDRKTFQQQWEDYLKKKYTEQFRKQNYILFKRNNETP